MSRDVTLVSSLRVQIFCLILVTLVGIPSWFAFEMQQLLARHNQSVQSRVMEWSLVVPVLAVESESSTDGICVPLLPVQLWNRNPEDVPVPPQWHRRVV